MTKRAAAVASGLLLTFGGLSGAATAADADTRGDVGAQACYDVINSYIKPAGQSYYPYGGPDLGTTSRCNDINILPNTSGYIAVCFKPSSGPQYCNGYRWAPAGQWTVVATDVRDGTRFYFAFASSARSTGGWAA
ncbi:hypothetical protein [Streptomyces sp. NPDC127098]|uniref:hypothetical protein n=1 Tax=Streptomyces sp. NPDC127098 TaxID=3347137 RepID=UPI0036692C99